MQTQNQNSEQVRTVLPDGTIKVESTRIHEGKSVTVVVIYDSKGNPIKGGAK